MTETLDIEEIDPDLCRYAYAGSLGSLLVSSFSRTSQCLWQAF